MVSFQCDACMDVVKKPKLDRHYGQCRSSFTCIDCGATFAGPEKWKVHTSCITEAEKYQKSLYKGPKKEHDSRSYNGYHRNSQLKATNTPGKYHQSYSNQPSWSHRQYIRNWASGANSTPLGSPLRMSPVDPLPAEPSPLSANAAKTEHGEAKKRDSGAVMENHALNGTEPKKKRKMKHDPTGQQQHIGKDAAADEPISLAGSSEKHKKDEKSGSNSQSKAQPSTEGIPEKSGDKKVKKRTKEKRDDIQPKQGDLTEEGVARPERVIAHADNGSKDDKKTKKRKHKEKRDEQVNEGGTVVEVATQPEPLASQTDDAKGKKKKKKSKEEKADLEGRLMTTADVITQDQATGDKRRDEGSVGNDGEKKRKKKRKAE